MKKSLKKGLDKDKIDVIKFREECRKFADHWVSEQKKQFCRFGIQTDWENIYLTMTKDSEITIVKELLKFLEKGDLFLGFKPVMWSVVEQSEDLSRKSSITIRFQVQFLLNFQLNLRKIYQLSFGLLHLGQSLVIKV